MLTSICNLYPEICMKNSLWRPFYFSEDKTKREHPWLFVTLKGRMSRYMCIFPFAQILIASLLQSASKQGWLLGYSFSFWADTRCTVGSCLDLVADTMAMTSVLCAPFQKGKAVVKTPSLLTSAPWLKDVVRQLWVYKMLHTEYFPWLLEKKPVSTSAVWDSGP